MAGWLVSTMSKTIRFYIHIQTYTGARVFFPYSAQYLELFDKTSLSEFAALTFSFVILLLLLLLLWNRQII